MQTDMTTRPAKYTPAVDLYTAGFPCQPYSLMGKNEGLNNKNGRGHAFGYVLENINHKLENVANITSARRL
eukprot:3712937-Lingulodinium_polyedra.AAC.1